ncbi:hypothetical protein J4G07_03455 [Candidatus Poribacteria bacterium]|nr:hypothetical protein [Candidatus Poribacteria bacterium]
MVSWKVALVVVIIVALVMAIGMWFGYRYVSEHDDLAPDGWHEHSNPTGSHLDKLCVLTPFLTSTSQE